MYPARIPRTYIVLIAIIVIICFNLPPHLKPYNFPADDSYFYLQVAHNIYEGNGSTLNQITPTNGYHPLWMLFCVFGFVLSGGDKGIAIHIIFLMQQALALGSLYFVYLISRQLQLKYWYLSIPVLSIYFFTGLYGSEAHINGFMTLLVLLVSLLSFHRKDRLIYYSIVTGLLAGLATLARLDNLFLIGPLFLFYVLEHARWKLSNCMTWRTGTIVLSLIISYLLVVSPYLAYNYLYYSHIVPISGAIKSTFPIIVGRTDSLSVLGKVVVLFAIFNFLVMPTKYCNGLRRVILLITSSGVLLHSLYLILFTSHATNWSWYYVVGVINMSISLSIYAEVIAGLVRMHRHQSIERGWSYMVIMFSLVLVLLGISRSWMRYYNPDAIQGTNPFNIHSKDADQRWQVELADWLRTNLPERSKVFIYDWPGTIAYISDKQILPNDGLINDYQYNSDVLEQGIATYLNEKKVAYWLGLITSDSLKIHSCHIYRKSNHYSIMVFSPLYRKCAGELQVFDKDIIVRFRDVLQHPRVPNLGLWRISSSLEG